MRSIVILTAAIMLLCLGNTAQADVFNMGPKLTNNSPLVSSNGSGMNYQIIDLGFILSGNTSEAWGINDNGQIVGFSTINPSPSVEHAFLWQNGIMTDLGFSGLGNSWALGINNSGQIVGYSEDSDGYHAYLWQNGNIIDLGGFGIDGIRKAYAINDSGQIVGSARIQVGDAIRDDACLWQNNGTGYTIIDLGTLPDSFYSEALAINNNGQIVGFSQTSDGTYHPCLWQNNGTGYTITDLGTWGIASGINNNDQIVGCSYFEGEGMHACLWQNGTVTDLSPLEPYESWAEGINDSGQIVGYRHNVGDTSHAYLWQNNGKGYTITDLNAFSGGINSAAHAINNNGQIVGYSENVPGTIYACLWQPGTTPPPSGPALAINNKAVYDPIMDLAQYHYNFLVFGTVSILNSSSFTVDDGSGKPVKVISSGYSGIQNGDYAYASGAFSGYGLNRVLNAQPTDVVKLK